MKHGIAAKVGCTCATPGKQILKMQFTRRELLAQLGKAAALPWLRGLVLVRGCGGGLSGPPPPPGDGYPGTDDQLLEEIEKAGFQFFWEQADPATGQVKDRALADGNDTRTVSSVAATGFGLTVLCIGDQRGYQPHAQIVARVQTTLSFLLNRMQPQGMNGFFYHFVDMESGNRAFHSEVSSIDTAILLCGILMCRQYFSHDGQISALASQIYKNVNFAWMLNGGPTLSMGWKPETGFLKLRWNTYNELMMLYLLAMASPTFPIPASCWSAWTRPSFSYQALKYIASTNTSLFTHQFSHAWFDFRNKKDAFADYFQNSITSTMAHQLFCVSLAGQFPDYSNDLWGITASDSQNGYVAWGGPPSFGSVDGTLVPCATAGSLPFDYSGTIHVLRWIRGHYPRAWQRYGYVDAFNPPKSWYDADVIGIDVGISVLMAENQRTQFVWKTFMKDPAAQSGMNLAGFHSA